ncbi:MULTISPECIES: hypothetical protein [Catenuloplanes]|uniref:Regulator of replication initiation timing n=1 Tax=Catenuloplanes niger TaxID=587534 RepID=A0AAE3ZVU0_9ACTN|nr:hypothetical protein [Catenuloplanes niger]MDR7325058.1 regulator of replication initiation timing [Catenuloplanes niger]
MDLTIEDFQQVLFELYMAQRENNQLRAEVAKLREALAAAQSHSHGPADAE